MSLMDCQHQHCSMLWNNISFVATINPSICPQFSHDAVIEQWRRGVSFHIPKRQMSQAATFVTPDQGLIKHHVIYTPMKEVLVSMIRRPPIFIYFFLFFEHPLNFVQSNYFVPSLEPCKSWLSNWIWRCHYTHKCPKANNNINTNQNMIFMLWLVHIWTGDHRQQVLTELVMLELTGF